MVHQVRIAPNVAFPAEVVTSTIAVIAIRGAGKTYTGCVLAEEMAAASLRFVAIDPMGAWWGLRASADGKSAGIPVVVLGGEHGDAPLDATAGAVVADLAVSESFSMVLDLKLMEKGDKIKFVTDFFRRLNHKNRDPLMVFVDESDLFAPQTTKRKDQVASLEALDDTVRRGRGLGLGVCLITQRAAVLNWDLLSQTETLIALRTISELDTDALHGWLKRSKKELREQFLSALPTLKAGEAFVWSPAFLEIFERAKIRARQTFDSSATPKVGQRRIVPTHLAEVDIHAVRAQLGAIIARASAEDPVALRGRIAQLEADLAESQRECELAHDEQASAASALATAVRTETKVVEVPVVLDGQKNDLRVLADELTSGAARMERFAQDVASATDRLRAALDTASAVHVPTPFHVGPSLEVPQAASFTVTRSPLPSQRTTEFIVHETPSKAEGAANGRLGGGEARVLANVYRFDARGGLTKVQLATLSGLKASGGGFNNYLGRLRSGLGYIEVRGDRYHCTEAGRKYAAHVWPTLPPLRQTDILALWLDKLGGGEKRIMDLLLKVYPRAISKTDIAKAVGLEAGGGGFNNYLGKLRSNALAENYQNGLRAGPALFLR